MYNKNDKKITPHAQIGIEPTHRLQWEEVQNCTVLLYPEGLIRLNETAAEILKLCDGEITVEAITQKLQEKYSVASVANDVEKFLQMAHKNGWIIIL